MQVIYHLGAHCTDNDRIVKCLLRNADALGHEGIIVPPVKRYRSLIAETMLKLRHQKLTMDIQDAMLGAVLPVGLDASRLVLSHEAFLGVFSQAIGEDCFYPMLDDKLPRLARLMGAHDVEFHIALSNPAIFIPDVFNKANVPDLETFLAGADPMQLRWSEMVTRLRSAVPTAKVVVWANEDTPLIWPQILQGISGHSNDTKLLGLDDFYASLMSPGGLKRMLGYLTTHPPKDIAHHQRIIAAFLDKFGIEDVIETEIDLPGWSTSYVEALSTLYDQDLALIADMDGVTFIAP